MADWTGPLIIGVAAFVAMVISVMKWQRRDRRKLPRRPAPGTLRSEHVRLLSGERVMVWQLSPQDRKEYERARRRNPEMAQIELLHLAMPVTPDWVLSDLPHSDLERLAAVARRLSKLS